MDVRQPFAFFPREHKHKYWKNNLRRFPGIAAQATFIQSSWEIWLGWKIWLVWLMRDVTSLTNGVMSYKWYSSFIALLGWDVLHHLIFPLVGTQLQLADLFRPFFSGKNIQMGVEDAVPLRVQIYLCWMSTLNSVCGSRLGLLRALLPPCNPPGFFI